MQEAREIILHTLKQVAPGPAISSVVSVHSRTNSTNGILTVAGRNYDLSFFQRVFVVGGGKAALQSAIEMYHILGSSLTAGIINVYREQALEQSNIFPDNRVLLFAADHPTPNIEGIKGALSMANLLATADSHTLVIALISGGGSSLMAIPAHPSISLQDYKDTVQLLLHSPAPIDNINAVRKHIDLLKGGRMRQCAKDAGAFITLVLSDVPVTSTGVADDPSVIASGPTVADETTFSLAKKILEEYNIWEKVPISVRDYILTGIGNKTLETLRKGSPLLSIERNQYVMVCNNDIAMEHAADKSRQLGFTTHMVGFKTGRTTDKIHGEVQDELQKMLTHVAPSFKTGDTITFASVSTDGVDGTSDLAGAVVDSNTFLVAKERNLSIDSFIATYNSARFFEQLGLGIQTGATGTNVADIALILITNSTDRLRKIAFVFGGEATVNVKLPSDVKPGCGGRNTHMVLLAISKLYSCFNT